MSNGYLNGKPDISWWRTQIDAGIKFRQKYAHEKRWDAWRQYYRGNWKGGILPSNIFFKMMRTIVPRIYFRNPSVSITPAKPGIEHLLFAQLLERIDNKLIKRMKLKQQIKSIVQDAFMFGTGVGKLGYGAEFTPSPNELDTQGPYGKNNTTFEYNQNVIANMPWFLRTHPGAFIVPPGLMRFQDSRYAIHWIRRPLADVKEDPRFKNVSSISGGTTTGLSTSTTTGANKEQQSGSVPEEMLDLFEIRDKKTRRVFVIAPYATDKILFDGDDDLQFRGRLSFYPIVFNEDDDVFWGVPDSHILEPIQLELNETRTMIMKHRRLSIAKIFAKKNAIPLAEALKMVSEDVLPVIEMDGDPNADIRFHEGSNIPNDLFAAFEATVTDARETVGFSRNEFGEYKPGSGDTTATEATIVRQASEIRVDERRDMIADMLVDVIEHIHHIIFSHWNEEQVVNIIGPNGVPVWIRFKPEILKNGSYEINIDPDTSVPETKQMRQQKAVQVFQMLNQDPMIDQHQLRRYLLHELHGTVFDSMLPPPGTIGSQQNPMSIQQAMQMFQQAGAGGAGANMAAIPGGKK